MFEFQVLTIMTVKDFLIPTELGIKSAKNLDELLLFVLQKKLQVN